VQRIPRYELILKVSNNKNMVSVKRSLQTPD